MTYNTKEIIKMLVLMSIYILLGRVGIYSGTTIFFMPILALPMIIYLINRKIVLKKEILITATVATSIFMLTLNIEEVLFFMLNVIVPSYLLIYLLRKEYTLPHIIMYMTTWIFVSLIGVVGVMRIVGVDYIERYFTMLQEVQVIYAMLLEQMVEAGGIVASQATAFNEIIEITMMFMQVTYPAIFFNMLLFSTIGIIGIVKIIGKLKKWQLPSIKQLFNFRLSKWSAVILAASFLMAQLSQTLDINMVALNAFLIMNTFYRIMGIIALIMLIKRIKTHTLVKGILTVVVIGICSLFASSLLVMLGVLDTVMNYRKVDIVV